MNLNLRVKQQNTYDAIVVGSGITGGWAAKELAERGLKTLCLERGRDVKHIEDYRTAEMDTWDLPNRGQIALVEREKHYPIQSQSGFLSEANKHFYVKDDEHPYQKLTPFNWYRGYQLGGSSITWDRQAYRWSDLDFEANLKDGLGVDWPIRYKDLAPWYSHVERFIGVSGQKLGLDHLPDGEFLRAMPMNVLEEHVRGQIQGRWGNRTVLPNRIANLTEYLEAKDVNHPNHANRQTCQYRNRCDRGCPYGASFSSLSSTLPAGLATGNLTIQLNSIVAEVIYNEEIQKAEGVRVINSEDNSVQEYYAKIMFLCASTVHTTSILLNSTSQRFPNGLGNDSGVLGKYLMDQHTGVGLLGSTNDYERFYTYGKRPSGVLIPRFRNLGGNDSLSFKRGYSFNGFASREGWGMTFKDILDDGIGAGTKERLMKPPNLWNMRLQAFGETIPNVKNHMKLSIDIKDKWGLPQVVFDVNHFGQNEIEMRQDMLDTAKEIFEESRINVELEVNQAPQFGQAQRLVGTARMGKNASEAVLNGRNQLHACKNVFVTDGASLPSSGNESPDLTLMALTVRAVDYAVKNSELV